MSKTFHSSQCPFLQVLEEDIFYWTAIIPPFSNYTQTPPSETFLLSTGSRNPINGFFLSSSPSLLYLNGILLFYSERPILKSVFLSLSYLYFSLCPSNIFEWNAHIALPDIWCGRGGEAREGNHQKLSFTELFYYKQLHISESFWSLSSCTSWFQFIPLCTSLDDNRFS